MVKGYSRKRKQRTNDLIYLAWHTEILSRQKKMPSLKSLLQDTEKKQSRIQTDDEMLAMCKMLNTAFGGDVIEV